MTTFAWARSRTTHIFCRKYKNLFISQCFFVSLQILLFLVRYEHSCAQAVSGTFSHITDSANVYRSWHERRLTHTLSLPQPDHHTDHGILKRTCTYTHTHTCSVPPPTHRTIIIHPLHQDWVRGKGLYSDTAVTMEIMPVSTRPAASHSHTHTHTVSQSTTSQAEVCV